MKNQHAPRPAIVPLVLLLAAPALAQDLPSPGVSKSPGLDTATYSTPQGKVSVFLPGDLAAGDRISGTVYVQPAGKDDRQKRKNESQLSGQVIDIGGEQIPAKTGTFSFTLPQLSDLAPNQPPLLEIVWPDSSRRKKGPALVTPISILPTPPPPPQSFVVPTVGQAGKALPIMGPFDGNLNTSGCTIGPIPAAPLAESPRGAVFQSPRDIVGGTRLQLFEHGQIVADEPFRCVAVSLAAPQVRLLRGDRTTLTTTVSGLQGLEQPVNVRIEVTPASVVTVRGGNLHQVTIQPDQVGADGTFTHELGLTGVNPGGWDASAVVTGPRPPPKPARFALILDGQFAGYVKSVSGGEVRAETVTRQLGGVSTPTTSIGRVNYEPLTLEMGMGGSRSIWDWIGTSFKGTPTTRNGQLIALDSQNRALAVHQFTDAYLTEVTIPALDASSKEPAYMTIKIDPTTVTHKKGDGKAVQGPASAATKKWLCSNFRIEIGDLPCDRVTKIDAFTWKQGITKDEVGALRRATRHPAKIELPDLRLSISMSDIEPWQDWQSSSVIGGDASGARQLDGSITFLGPDLKDELATIDLTGVGLVSVNMSDAQANRDELSRFTVKLSCDTMTYRSPPE